MIWQTAHQVHLAFVLIMVVRKDLESQCRCIGRMTGIINCGDREPWACLLLWLNQSFRVLGIWFIMHLMHVLATKQCSSLSYRQWGKFSLMQMVNGNDCNIRDLMLYCVCWNTSQSYNSMVQHWDNMQPYHRVNNNKLIEQRTSLTCIDYSAIALVCELWGEDVLFGCLNSEEHLLHSIFKIIP